MIFLLFSVNACKRFDPESIFVITTDSIEPLSAGNYELIGTIVNIGAEEITQHGFQWSVEGNSILEGPVTQLGNRDSNGSYSSVITVLAPSTKYYVRTYAETRAGTEFGRVVSFTSGSAFPKLPFDDIHLYHILSVQLSTASIDGSDNLNRKILVGTIILFRTNEGRYGKLRIQEIDYNLTLNWVTYNIDGTVHTSGENLIIHGTWSADLDEGLETNWTDSNDFWWEMVTSEERYLTPRNGAEFYLYY
ncbi:MAG: hypothetical protein KAR19_18245 [Bacteroidales bacterium]|nr:hypothetical protein [Bacteroidales bacterium]